MYAAVPTPLPTEFECPQDPPPPNTENAEPLVALLLRFVWLGKGGLSVDWPLVALLSRKTFYPPVFSYNTAFRVECYR